MESCLPAWRFFCCRPLSRFPPARQIRPRIGVSASNSSVITATRHWLYPMPTASFTSTTVTRRGRVPEKTAERDFQVNHPSILCDHLFYAERLAARSPQSIELAVIHCTELPDLALARRYGERIHYPESGTGNSGHFYIERNGKIHEWVPANRVAHHTRGFNEQSVGIEMVNRGRYPDWFDSRRQEMKEAYSEIQLESLCLLLLLLKDRLNALRFVAGHDALDTQEIPSTDDPARTVRRKVDPGPLFPWELLLLRTGLERYPLP